MLVVVAALGLAALGAACAGSDDVQAASGGRGDDAPAVIAGEQAAPADGQRAMGMMPEPSNGEPRTGQAGPSPSLLDRKIIQTATLTVALDDVSRGFQDVTNIALGADGFVASSSFGNTGERQTASLTVRVPAAAYNETLRQLRGLGEVRDVNTGANDVTEEYTDLESRLRNLRATEQRYMELLAQANTIDEILTVQDRVNVTRLEVEQVQGRINLLANQADLATITVHLAPPAVAMGESGGGSTTPVEAAERAFAASLEVLMGAAVVVVTVVAFSWWLLPLAVALAWFLRRQMRSTGAA
jgi:hypothetical protein